jgi:hypothetical protein
MKSARATDLLVPAFYTIAALVLLWDVVLAGQIAQLRKAPPTFRGITALAGLLIAPAVAIVIASASVLDGRAIHLVAWIWPATLVIFAAQAVYATARRLVTAFLGVPIAIYDILLAGTAIARYGVYTGLHPTPPALAFSAAEANALGTVLGHSAHFSPLALLVPLLAPAYPAQWRSTKVVRGVMALAAAVWGVMIALEIPRGYMAVTSYRRYIGDRLRERPRGDFAVGVRILPDLGDAPAPLALRNDLALLDSIDAGAIAIVVDPARVRAAGLDSLGRAIDQARRDSVQLIVGIGYTLAERERFRVDPARAMRERVAIVDRIARRLRPDILLPAVDPYTEGTRVLGPVPPQWWEEYLRLSARTVRQVNRRIRIGVAASSFTGPDSVLFAWAAAPGSPIDIAGFSLYPSYDGGAALDARMRVAERWLRRSTKESWVFGAGGFPLVHGEASQERAVWGALAWATAHGRIKGLIVDGAADYDRMMGLRAPGGRLRPVATTVARAIDALAETRGP